MFGPIMIVSLGSSASSDYSPGTHGVLIRIATMRAEEYHVPFCAGGEAHRARDEHTTQGVVYDPVRHPAGSYPVPPRDANKYTPGSSGHENVADNPTGTPIGDAVDECIGE